MRRLACAALLMSCQTVFPPFDSDGGGVHGGTTVIGGTTSMDLAVPHDMNQGSAPTGTIVVHSGAQSSISATFDAGCQTSTVAGCRFHDCTPADLSVGTLRFNVGSIHVVSPKADLTLSPQSDGVYIPITQVGPLWSDAGAQVTITGSGADYGGFTTTLAGPTPITVNNPLASALDVPRTGDFEVDWTDGTTGDVIVELANATQTLSCSFAVAASSATVPTAALQLLTAGAATLTIAVASTATVDSVVEVRAESAGQDASGKDFTVSVNLR